MADAHARWRSGSYYTGCYPTGAFLVADKRSLGPLVRALRDAQLLKKSTRNVTDFFPAYALLLPPPDDTAPEAETGLQHRLLYISKTQTVAEAAAAAAGPAGGEAPMDCLQRDVRAHLDALCAQEEVLPLVTLPAGTQPDPAAALLAPRPSSAAATAVHVAGALTPPCLAHYLSGAYLPPAQPGQTAAAAALPPVAFIYFLRGYSRPCYAAAELARLPPRQQALLLRTPAEAPPPAAAFSFTELFGGIGMFRLGLEAAGGTAALAVEMAPAAAAVYEANFPSDRAAGTLWAGDLTDLPSYLLPRGHGLLSAGFPCQSFAKAGPALGLKAQYGQLFYEVVRALRACEPACFLLENVANLVEVEEGRQLAEILRWLRDPLTGTGATPRYDVAHRVLDGGWASPQVRRRVYFIGVRRDSHARVEADLTAVFDGAELRLQQLHTAATAHVLYRTVRDVLLSSRAWRPETGCYADLDGYLRGLHLSHTQWEALGRTQSIRRHPEWRVADLRGRARTLMGSYRTSYQLYSEFVPTVPDGADVVAAVRRTLAALDEGQEAEAVPPAAPKRARAASRERPAPAAAGDFVSPLRFFAPRECARLQGIPDGFQLQISQEQPFFDTLNTTEEGVAGDRPRGALSVAEGTVYKLIGNAVNPIVIECIVKSLLEVFPLGARDASAAEPRP
uniref:DNA (cytosine-5-)-methyltransferase n=1 Tax=Strigomonas culicis TaxID=28005 RepID=U5KL31_9TRYP|nr:DNA (cytosine-5-) methyltransferase [Strigomonas culicis]